MQTRSTDYAALALGFTLAALTAAWLSACSSAAPAFDTRSDTVAPATRIDWLGQETALKGEGQLKLGSPLPDVTLSNARLKPEHLAPGKVRLISVVPSLDTEVCDRQTHMLSDSKDLAPEVERVTVSRDLPYAQTRFTEEAKTRGILYYSDYRAGEFGRKLGLEIERNGLLARALIVTDAQGIVRHYQIVPSIYALPDLRAAIAAANRWATSTSPRR